MKTFNVLLLFASLILISIDGISQENIYIKGTVKDTLNNPVDFANIGVYNKNIGTVSNENGAFNLSIPIEFTQDSLTFSRIGFHSKTIAINEFKEQNNIVISMLPKVTNIKEIQIVAKHLKEKTKGNKTDAEHIVIYFEKDSTKLGFEGGSVINLPNKSPVKIKDFNLNIVSNIPDSAKFRLNIYDYSKKVIGDCLLDENIYFTVIKKNQGNYKVDLSKYNIYASGKVLVSIEQIAIYSSEIQLNYKNKPIRNRILISGTITGSKGFSRKVSLGNWKKIPHSLAPGFWITILK